MKKYSLVFRLVAIIAICTIIFVPRPALAVSINDYFNLSYNAQFSQTQITGTQGFTITITGTASCKQDLAFPYNLVSDVVVQGSIVAVNSTTGASVTLNPGYTLQLSNIPHTTGQTIQQSVPVDLRFPSGSPDGTYTVSGPLVKAQAKALVWMDVTSYLPPVQAFGSVVYSSGVPSGGNPGGGGGGFGGSPSPTVTLPPSASHPTSTVPAQILDITGKSLADFLNSDRTISQTLTAESADKSWKVIFSPGTRVQWNGSGSTIVMLNPSGDIQNQGTDIQILGQVFTLSPSGAIFAPPVLLTVSYDPATLPPNIILENLVIAYWDNTASVWIPLTCTVDTATHTVSTLLGHFNDYALAVKKSGAPAQSIEASPTLQVTSPPSTPYTAPVTITSTINKISPSAPADTGPTFPFNWWLVGGIALVVIAGAASWIVFVRRR